MNKTNNIEARPKVSVIVPFYRVEKYIEKCAVSLMHQTLTDMEFIFVDDCGGDNSAVILQQVVEQYPDRKVKIVKQEKNMGVSIARARGMEEAQGEYLGFCDSDDWVDKDMYRLLYEGAKKQEADIVGCGFIEHKEGHETSFLFDSSEDNEETMFSFSHFGGVYGALWNKIIRRDFFLTYNEHLGEGLSMWEDSLTLIPLRLKSKKTVFLSDCPYHYNVNENSNTVRFSMRKVNDSIEAVVRLENYLIHKENTESVNEFLNSLKINAKEVLLRFPTRDNLQIWRQTFPECHSFLWRYPQWNMLLKVRAWLVSVLPFDLAMIVLRIMRR